MLIEYITLLESEIKKAKQNSPLELVNHQSYLDLLNLLKDDQLNLYRKRAIIDYLDTCFRCNYSSLTLHTLMTDLKETVGYKKLVQQTQDPKKVVIYLAGTGDPIGVHNALFDEYILKALADDTHPAIAVKAVSGVGIRLVDGRIGLKGEISFLTGHSMAKRVQDAYDQLQGYTQDNARQIQIFGHSRGAVEALGLGKLCSIQYNDTTVIAHDPVLGSPTTSEAMNEPLIINERSHPFSTVLSNGSVSIKNLLVILRKDDDRSRAYAFYDEKNAYAAENRAIVAHPGFHNCGVYKGASTCMDIRSILTPHQLGWYVGLAIDAGMMERAKHLNQDFPSLDAHRDQFKEFLYIKNNELIQAFIAKNNFNQISKQIAEELMSQLYPVEIRLTPAYDLLQTCEFRTIPHFMLEHIPQYTLSLEIPADNFNVRHLLYQYNTTPHLAIKVDLQKIMLLKYAAYLMKGEKADQHAYAESLFAILSHSQYRHIVRHLKRNENRLTWAFIKEQLSPVLDDPDSQLFDCFPNDLLFDALLYHSVISWSEGFQFTPQQWTAFYTHLIDQYLLKVDLSAYPALAAVSYNLRHVTLSGVARIRSQLLTLAECINNNEQLSTNIKSHLLSKIHQSAHIRWHQGRGQTVECEQVRAMIDNLNPQQQSQQLASLDL